MTKSVDRNDSSKASEGSAKSEPLISAERRRALKRLGLAVSVAYVTPTLTTVNEASAQPPWVRPSRPIEPPEPTH